MAEKRFVIRWMGSLMNPAMDYLKRASRRGRGVTSAHQADATRFDSHDEAVKFCKEHVRHRRFGGDWQSLCQIEEVWE